MDLYFLRHASAGEAKLNPVKDEQRPLDKLGFEQSHNVGRALAALEVTLDLVVSSPLLRAVQTAAAVAEEIGFKKEVITDAALRPEATYPQFQELLAHHNRTEAILVVGHNPSLTEFLNKTLAGEAATIAIELKKGGIAKVERPAHDAAILKWYLPPKVVRAIQQASAKSSRPKTVSK
jgi:phosphohistidine phosphatase